MNCLKCHKTVEADSQFCRFCGASLGSDATHAEAGASGGASGGGSVSAETLTTGRTEDRYRDPMQEEQVWEGRPAWRAFYGSWLAWLAGSIVLLVVVYKSTQPESGLRTWTWILVRAVAVVLGVRELLFVFNLSYRITTQRLFVHRGILTRVTDQMELLRVDDVRLRQGVIDRIVNTGDVEVMGTDETDEKVTLESVSAPAEVAEALRRHVRAVRGKQTLFVENI